MMTSNAKILYDALVVHYPGAFQSITDISKNTSGSKLFIECDEKAFNFDLVYNFAPCHRSGNGAKEKSPDALFCLGSILYFVEFKEGKVDKEDVRLKALDGINTLYQFCGFKKLMSKEDFFNIDFRYALIYRNNMRGGGAFVAGLEATINKCNLQNLEGFIYNKTATRFSAEGVLAVLNSASNGVIRGLSLISDDQKSKETVSC